MSFLPKEGNFAAIFASRITHIDLRFILVYFHTQSRTTLQVNWRLEDTSIVQLLL